jgi:8-oxo-dGTP pyrophosphatase MutT (NUDIX family)
LYDAVKEEWNSASPDWKKMAKKKSYVQYAALPFTRRNGRMAVMLVTSRETRRWVIPKGWPINKLSPSSAAALEAFEEAGIIGKIEQTPHCTFQYRKKLSPKKTVLCTVHAFLLEVTEELAEWPEQEVRERCWFTPEEAAKLVSEPDLRDTIMRLKSGDDSP